MADGAAATEALETRESLEATIIAQYETEAERAAARMVLGSIHGIDFETGMAVEEAEPAKAETDAARLMPEIGAEDPEKTAAAAAAGETAETAEEKAAREADEAREAAGRAKDDRIAELEAQVALNDQDGDIRKAVSDKMAAAIAENEQLNEADEARVTKFAEDYGDEAAAQFRTSLEASQKLRADALAQTEQDEIDQARATAERDVTAETQLQRDLNATPELKAWREDAEAARAGTDGKTANNYNLAVAVDSALRENALWAGKPQAERFAEVVKMVKLSTGASSAGAPGTQETDKDTKTAAEIDKEIARKAGSVAVPGSLSAIPGGDPGDGDVMAKMENLDAAEVADMGLTVDQLDRIAEAHEAALDAA